MYSNFLATSIFFLVKQSRSSSRIELLVPSVKYIVLSEIFPTVDLKDIISDRMPSMQCVRAKCACSLLICASVGLVLLFELSVIILSCLVFYL